MTAEKVSMILFVIYVTLTAIPCYFCFEEEKFFITIKSIYSHSNFNKPTCVFIFLFVILGNIIWAAVYYIILKIFKGFKYIITVGRNK